MLKVFACAIKYTLQQNFLLALLYRWMIIYLTDFHVIGHLFSSKILNVSNNAMIDDFEHKFHKCFLIQDYFICMENLASDLSLPIFQHLFFFFLWALTSLGFYFPFQKFFSMMMKCFIHSGYL